MKIAISGYGRMGHLIEQVAGKHGFDVSSTIDPVVSDARFKQINRNSLKNVDVVIDFSTPGTAVENIRKAAAEGKNIVMGTTGWYTEKETVRKIVEDSGIGLIWSGNFSTGVNLFFRIVRSAAALFNNFDAYDPFIHEYHHNKKADSPSGTASMLGDIILDEIDRKKTAVTELLKRRIEPEELHISSTRGGSIPGTHTVTFDSDTDTIELKHTARGREGFAEGAVAAAAWIEHKKGFFDINDMMKDIIKGAI